MSYITQIKYLVHILNSYNRENYDENTWGGYESQDM